jgi:hypothetical protein
MRKVVGSAIILVITISTTIIWFDWKLILIAIGFTWAHNLEYHWKEK